MTTGIRGAAYAVGELELPVESLSNRVSRLADFDMPDLREIWGWGFFRKTLRGSAALAVESAQATLRQSGVLPGAVDGLILCSGRAMNYHAQSEFTGAVAHALGLGRVFSTWAGGSGCASLFSATRMAMALVESGDFSHILVISADAIDDENDRFQRFGVLSDAACSFLVVSSAQADYVVRGAVVQSCPASLIAGGNDFQAKCQLIYSVFERLGRESGTDASQAGDFVGSNVFLPIQELEMSVMPLEQVDARQGNTQRYGHCFAADPIINLVDRVSDARQIVMAATAHGHFGAVLLESVR